MLAIWIEKDGVFVKTRKAMANQRKQYLYTWRASSNYNVVDAITGSTINSHQTHTIEWDCTDLNGDLVPDGSYTLKIEFADKHAQGPMYSIDFVKGTEPISLTPPNQTNYINMQFTYTPEVTAIADFGANVTEACVQQDVIFTDNSTGATSWNWNFGNGAVPQTAANQGPHTVKYTSVGPKTVALTINGDVVVTKSNYVTINPDAIAGFTHVITGNTVTFANTSQNASSYTWDFGDGTSSTETHPMHTFTADGTYTVSVTANSAACADDIFTTSIDINTVGIAENENSVFDISPNPSSGSFNITFLQNVTEVAITVFDNQGKEMQKWIRTSVTSGEILSATESKLKPGVYFVELVSGEKHYRKKLIVK
ncbi:MAG: cell surface protein [Bacteroidetes bacterium]|nr:MAG: cell surface protein [Bacteroidota bacterium]